MIKKTTLCIILFLACTSLISSGQGHKKGLGRYNLGYNYTDNQIHDLKLGYGFWTYKNNRGGMFDALYHYYLDNNLLLGMNNTTTTIGIENSVQVTRLIFTGLLSTVYKTDFKGRHQVSTSPQVGFDFPFFQITFGPRFNIINGFEFNKVQFALSTHLSLPNNRNN